ncbi:type III-B CRISPR module-associated protein Cmr5 [Hydrogenivirga sp. 128-5-R1-1]|uniref:type III-B CRISPR module-associated protein Cmr5 n=1 Tax=Hydrogenivirga sp. 128-5-R1-1 TaxID=392423 RepID=UPI00015F0C72|nr:type III-B CRISPR module-associated protein Cmr5 [Hydrogenivirga sp. 128-5-R1-1]EDP75976.1 hypothetical protein HG1285_06605 [Hydrogenivirga sp. 128-5-R1-1]
MKSLEQERMKKAYEFVKDMKNKDIKKKKEYLSLVRKLPAMIVHNGLITTFVFLKSKEGKENKDTVHKELLKHLIFYLESRGMDINSYESFKERMGDIELEEYLFVTQDVLAFATWLKRIAEGEIEDESN